MKFPHFFTFLIVALNCIAGSSEEIASCPVYSVIEIEFTGPAFGPADAPARDVEFWAVFQHESSQQEYKIHGFWDGDGKGGMKGNVFKIRFCPTEEGKWTIQKVFSDQSQLNAQHEGDWIVAKASNHPGFWIVDENSPGRRWYRRSGGSHPYIVGNTMYSFLSNYKKGGKPSGNDIVQDVRDNAKYFKKLRFNITGDIYPNPDEKPFLDDDGKPADWGDYSHRPNPRWFHQRVDAAVKAAYETDLIADIILAGPDSEASRSILRAQHNGGDPSPYLRYMAARYGSYPNVWMCLCNEYEIKTPKYDESAIALFGQTIREFLPYPTPLSVHSTPRTLWSPKFDAMPPWYDHHILQKKIRKLAPAADVIQDVWQGPDKSHPRNKPTIDDELSYQGEGDKHSEGDTIESHVGVFLGGGYGTTGEKPGNKLGQYFRGKFDASEHTAADNLLWLRTVIDENISFWKMQPGLDIFSNLDKNFRGLAWDGHEYVLGTNSTRQNIQANLPEGVWTVTQYDVMSKTENVIAESASGSFLFNAPESRAVLFHFKQK